MTKMYQINRVAETLFRQLIAAGSEYQATIFSTVKEYKAAVANVQRTADERYKVKDRKTTDFSLQQKLDSEKAEEERVMNRLKDEYITEKKDSLRASARQKIRAAQDGFQVTARETAKNLRDQLEEAILSPINAGFLRLAQTMIDFGVAPSRLELDALLTLSEGNLTATRCLDSLLKKTEAPFSITYKTPDEYSKDLELIEQLGTDDYFCSPLDVHHEIVEIFKGEKVSRDEDSSLYKRGVVFDSSEMLIQGTSFNTAMEKLEGMVSSWSSDIHFQAADDLSEKMENDEKILAEIEKRDPDLKEYESSVIVNEDNEDNEAIGIAKKLGRERAKAERPVTETLGNLIK